MKKLKKTMIALAAVLAISPVATTFATNSNNNFTLTLSQATQRAVQTNRDLRTLAENVIVAELAFDQAQSNLNATIGVDMEAFIVATALQMEARIDVVQSQIDETILRETLAFYVMHQFATIHMAEQDIILFDQELAVMDADLAILRALVSVGFASQADYELATAQRELVLHSRQNLSRALDQAHLQLNRLIGAPANRRHNLVFDLPQQPFEELVVINMQGLINHQRQTHSSVEQARRQADIEAFRLENRPSQYMEVPDMQNPVFLTNPMTGEPLINPQTGEPILDIANMGMITVPNHQVRTEAEFLATAQTAGRAAAEARDTIERHIQDQYVAIRRMERDIESLQLQIEELQSGTAVLQTRIDVGEILAVEMLRHDLAIAQRQQELDNAILQHHMAVIRFRNPNVSLFL